MIAVTDSDILLERERRRRRSPVIPLWQPQPGPQAAAFACTADQIGYGGGAGGGKTDLALGMAALKHRRSAIFRRTFPSVRGIIERSREIFAREVSVYAKDSYNEQLHIWRLSDGAMIEFGSLQREDDKRKHQGQPRDLIVFDEATEFSESQVRFVSAWNRSTAPGVVCQLLLTFNPPMSAGQAWVVKFFAPWLDPRHADPAADGEVRYVAMVDGAEQFYRSPDDAPPGAGLKTRTFFHAALADNPILAATGYGDTIDALPEPLRSILRGSFGVTQAASPWQVIPSEWIAAAQARWREDGRRGPCSGVGLDVARGGADQTTRAELHGAWVAPLLAVPGASTPTGGQAAALVLDAAAAGVPVGVDLIGVGASAFDHLYGLGYTSVVGVNAAARAETPDGDPMTDHTGRLRFRNLRAAMWWYLREALDPTGPDPLALPPDEQLASDLAAPMWQLTSGGVLIESKDEIRERLGHSPDRADALGHALMAPLLSAPSWLIHE